MKSTSRRHGWQLPLHPLQIVGMALYAFLVVSFYCFLWPFLGNRIAKISLITVFSSVALSVMVLFIRCTAIDPSDKSMARRKYQKSKAKVFSKLKLSYGVFFLVGRIFIRAFRRIERKILKTFIRRKYLVDPRITHVHFEPLLPFPLIFKQDTVSPKLNDVEDEKEEEDIDVSFCVMCDVHVKKRSKHCRTCNRCVEGFDHHCRWLNNCVGKRNYTTFFLLLLFVLLMLFIEGGTAIAVFIRCFADKNGIKHTLAEELHWKFPRGLLAAICMFLVLMTAYGSAALGQLFFFHIVLIKKGMRTYDYILAMKEEHHFSGFDSLDDSDFSSDSDSSEPDSPETSMSKTLCKGLGTNKSPGRFSSKNDPESGTFIVDHSKGFRAKIDPWTLIQMRREKAMEAAEAARKRLAKENQMIELEHEHENENEHALLNLNPLPCEMKSGPLVKKPMTLSIVSPRRISSPRRRFSGSPANQKYKSNFDLKLTEVSRELETYISRQVLCSVLTDGNVASPK